MYIYILYIDIERERDNLYLYRGLEKVAIQTCITTLHHNERDVAPNDRFNGSTVQRFKVTKCFDKVRCPQLEFPEAAA